MRLALPVLVAVSACTEAPRADVDGISCQRDTSMRDSEPPPALDVVLVISDAPSMALHRRTLVDNLHAFADVFATVEGGLPSIRIGVVDGSGELAARPRLVGCEPPDGPWIEDLGAPWFWCADDPDACRERNHEGDLGDTLACVGAVEADGAPAPPLLARLEHALGAADFVRPYSLLLVVLIGPDDDASPDDPLAYAERLLAYRDDPGTIIVSLVGGPATLRFDVFLDAFWRNQRIAIDRADWSEVASSWSGWGPTIVSACVDPAGLAQPLDCLASEADGTAIPPCVMASRDRPARRTPLPCYWFDIDDTGENGPTCPISAIVERALGPQLPLATLHCACEVVGAP